MYLFCYGTLMEGESRAGIMEQLGFEKVGNCSVQNMMMFHNWYGGYPIILKSKDKNDIINGELYKGTLPSEYDAELLSVLDKIEGEGQMYYRQKITTKCNGKFYHPYAYIGNYEFWGEYIKKGYISPLVNNIKWSQSLFEE